MEPTKPPKLTKLTKPPKPPKLAKPTKPPKLAKPPIRRSPPMSYLAP